MDTTSRVRSKRRAISSFPIPLAAMSTILARKTSRYADVYLRARFSRVFRVAPSRTIWYGLFLGIGPLLSEGTIAYNLRRCNYGATTKGRDEGSPALPQQPTTSGGFPSSPTSPNRPSPASRRSVKPAFRNVTRRRQDTAVAMIRGDGDFDRLVLQTIGLVAAFFGVG